MFGGDVEFVTVLLGLMLLGVLALGCVGIAVKAIRWLTGEDERTGYPPDWARISIRLKHEVKWTCEGCHVKLEDSKELLHVHHVNRDTWDNRRRNLRALCVECHSRQPGVGHRRLAGSIRSDGRLQRVRAIRRRQEGWVMWLMRLVCWFWG